VSTIVTRVDPDSYNFGNPVDCLTAYQTKLSLAHLITESTQVRVNWVNVLTVDSLAATNFGVAGTPTITFSEVYPHTWLSATQLANIDLCVACRMSGSGTEMTVRARIVPAHYALGNLTCPSLIDISGTTSSTTATTVIDEQQLIPSIVSSLFATSFDGTNGAEVEDGVTSIAVQSMMRLEISIDTDDDLAEIVAVYLREYAADTEVPDETPAVPTEFPSLTWTERRAADTVIWAGVLRVEALGLYIAYGYDTADDKGIMSTSTDDGATWTDRQTAEIEEHWWNGMAYETSSGRLVAVGGNYYEPSTDPGGKCITSGDLGVTWTAYDILPGETSVTAGGGGGSAQWQNVLALPGGRLVACAALADIDDGQHYVATSDDGGSTWTARNMPAPYDAGSTYWGQLAANADGSVLVMPNNDTGADAAVSDDYGHTWTITALPFTSSDTTYAGDVTFGDGQFVAVGAEPAIGYDKAWASTDGTTWTLVDEAGATFTSYCVEFVNAAVPFFLIGGYTSPSTVWLRASYDGVTWYDSADPEPSDESPWSGAAYSEDLSRIAMVNQGGVIITGDFA